MTLDDLLESVCDRHRGLGTEINVHVEASAPDGSKAPDIARSPEMIHGLGNIVENAVGFAATAVDVAARWTGSEIEIVVRDDGPGFPLTVLARLGEPYVSERNPGDGSGGLGLGFFIAKTLLERTGAKIEARNRTPPKIGAVVRATWARAAIEAPPL